MKALLVKKDIPIGSHTEHTSMSGAFVIVDTKEVGIISFALKRCQVSICCYPDEWGGEVKDISVHLEKRPKETKLPKELRGLKIIKLDERGEEIELPNILAGEALGLATKKAIYEEAKKRFEEYHEAIKTLIGHLKSSKGSRLIGGKK